MTKQCIQARIAEIHDNAYDPETAHAMEDDLMIDFLKAIAAFKISQDDLVELAQLVLTTSELDFPRWHA